MRKSLRQKSAMDVKQQLRNVNKAIKNVERQSELKRSKEIHQVVKNDVTNPHLPIEQIQKPDQNPDLQKLKKEDNYYRKKVLAGVTGHQIKITSLKKQRQISIHGDPSKDSSSRLKTHPMSICPRHTRCVASSSRRWQCREWTFKLAVNERESALALCVGFEQHKLLYMLESIAVLSCSVALIRDLGTLFCS